MRVQRPRGSRPYRPGLDVLEERRTPAQFGVPWHNAYHLAVSFVPDGTLAGAQRSDLFRVLDARMPTADWQREILRAFQTWAIHAHINFAVKADGGQPLGVPGPDQADPRFGDIRIGAVAMSPEVLSISVPHDPFLSGTWSGDVLLNSAALADPGADLFPILLHEVGHVLGIDHSRDPASVMFAHLGADRADLDPRDVAAVEALYNGPRPRDAFEGPRWNETPETASPLPAPPGFDGTTPLLVYGDIAAVRALYGGPRPPDPFEGEWHNETFETASPIPAPPGFDGTSP
ncbi:MAG TPA: matrixin family metalloprotease, partial [Isosphaeraceae bacterium]